MDFSSIIPIILLAVVIDIVFGELPSQIHPVVLMGNIIGYFKNLKDRHSSIDCKFAGALLTFFLIIFFSGIFVFIISFFKFNHTLLIIISSILLSTTFSIKLLLSSAASVNADINLNLDKARISLSYLVSRDTSELSRENIISAVIETLTENITDSVVSPFFIHSS